MPRLVSEVLPCAWTRAVLSVVTILFTLAWVSPARADSVLLIVQAGIDQDPAPCELRLRSEFAAEGLEVVTASTRAKQSLLDLEGLARRTGAVAGLSVIVDVQSIDGRLWVIDPSSRVDLVRTIHVPRTEGDPVSVFALRAVEALRGARIELEHQKRKLPGPVETATGAASATPAAVSPPATTSPVAKPAQVPRKPNPEPPKARITSASKLGKPAVAKAKSAQAAQSYSWLLQATGAFGWELNDLGAVIGPGLELRRSIVPRLSAALALDGPLFSKLEPRAGTVVHVDQELASVQLRWSPLVIGASSLDVFGMSGLSRFAVRGEAQPPIQGHRSHGFGWVFGAGIGFGVKLSSRFRIGLDAEWLRRLPAPVIIESQDGRIRRFTGDTDSLLLGKLGFGVMF